MGIAKHFETGESLPEDVYLKLVAARTYRAGSLSLRQVSYVLVNNSFPYFYLKLAYVALISLSIEAEIYTFPFPVSKSIIQ